MTKFYTMRGCIHIHTTYSDGTSSPMDIIKAAKKVGLDYIIFSDHFNIEAKKFEGKIDDIFVIAGYEWDDNPNNHSIILNVDHVFNKDESIEEVIKKTKFFNGKLFMAHPDEKRNFLKEYPPYPWTLWDAREGITGIEIWNQMSEWMENLRVWNKIINYFLPKRLMNGPTEKVLNFWDETNKKRKFPAIGSVDVHAYKLKKYFINAVIFPYEFSFNTIRTNLLFKENIKNMNYEKGRKEIIEAISNGQSYIVNNSRNHDNNFECYIKCSYGEFLPGSEILLEKDTLLCIDIDPKASIEIFRDGKSIYKDKGEKNYQISIQVKGNYRIEAKINNKNWLYTNNFYVK